VISAVIGSNMAAERYHEIVLRRSEKEIGLISEGGVDFVHRLNKLKNGVAMNATTTTISSRSAADSKFALWFRAFCQEARRAIELVGASYQHGLPPM
jgi:hypothetical protein